MRADIDAAMHGIHNNAQLVGWIAAIWVTTRRLFWRNFWGSLCLIN